MFAARTKPSRGKAVWVLVLLVALGLSAALLRSLLKPRPQTVAEAQSRLSAARRNLKAATDIATAATALSQSVGGTNSPMTRTVRSAGDTVVQKLIKENEIAGVEVQLAEWVETANYCVQRYADEGRAQEARAALLLGGIKPVVIRPPGRSNAATGGLSYEVLVPKDDADKAVAVLNHVDICQVKSFPTISSAFQAVRTLEARGIHATVQAIKAAGRTDTPDGRFQVFVLGADAESARNMLGGSSITNASLR